MRLLIIISLAIFLLSCNNLKHDKNSVAAKTTVIAIHKDTTKKVMTDTLKNEVIEEINIDVKSGFYDKSDIFSRVDDYLYEIPFDSNWAKKQIDKIYTTRLKEQSTWQPVTDFDKLAQVFDKLNTTGIIALHNAGMSKEDGEDDCDDIHDELLKQGIKTSGFCYYHWQDIERVVDDGHLYIGFGDFNNNAKDAAAIGKEVATALENKGFKLIWDKTADTRIEITNIKWRKRFGNDNCSYDWAKLLLKKTSN